MQIAIFILIIASIIIGLGLAAYGVYGLIKGETYIVNMRVGEIKASGKIARKFSLYYIFGGLLWVFYAILRLVEL